MGRWSVGRLLSLALALGAAAVVGCGDGLIGEAILGSGGDDGDKDDPPPPNPDAPIQKPDAPVVVIPDAPAPAAPDAPPAEAPPTFDVTGLTRDNVMSIAEA